MIIKRNKTVTSPECIAYPAVVEKVYDYTPQVMPPPLSFIADAYQQSEQEFGCTTNIPVYYAEECGFSGFPPSEIIQFHPVDTYPSAQDYINSFKMTYCFCTSHPEKSIDKKSSPTAQRSKDKQLSKSEINLTMLKDYEWEPVEKENPMTGHKYTVFKCTYKNCNKEMETTWNMLDHARMHKGVKPYECPYCKKKFTQKGNMRKHAKLHLTPHVEARRKYKCEFCGGGFTEKYNLMTHCKTFHKKELAAKKRGEQEGARPNEHNNFR